MSRVSLLKKVRNEIQSLFLSVWGRSSIYSKLFGGFRHWQLNIDFFVKYEPLSPVIVLLHICSYLLFVVGVLACYFDTSPEAMNYIAATARAGKC